MTDERPTPRPKDGAQNTLRSEAGPWGMCPAWVMMHAGLTDGEFRIYAALRTWADRAGNAYPTAAEIGDRAGGKAKGTVRNAVQRFERLGLVRVTPTFWRNGGQAGNDYLLVDVMPADLAERVAAEEARGGTPHSAGGGALCNVGGVHHTVHPGTSHGVPKETHHTSHQEPPPPPPSQPSPPAPVAVSEEGEESPTTKTKSRTPQPRAAKPDTDEVAAAAHADAAAQVLEAAQTAGHAAPGRRIRGKQAAELTAQLAGRLAAGWTTTDAVDALSDPLDAVDSVYGTLRWRVENRLDGPPPARATTGRRNTQADDPERAIMAKCPDCDSKGRVEVVLRPPTQWDPQPQMGLRPCDHASVLAGAAS